MVSVSPLPFSLTYKEEKEVARICSSFIVNFLVTVQGLIAEVSPNMDGLKQITRASST